MRWSRGQFTVEMTNEPGYSLGSADNVTSYASEYMLGKANVATSKHGVACFAGHERLGSAIIAASGGGTGVHERSLVLLDDRCCAAVGQAIACMALPELGLLWHAEVDQATCFGVHLTLDRGSLIVHGELEISRVTLDGRRLWGFSGRDIFTGDLQLGESSVQVVDFNGARYAISLESGGSLGAA